MINKGTVHLRVYYSNGRDAKLNFDGNGKVQNDNVLVKLTYGDLEWSRYIKNIKSQGLIEAKVEKVIGSDIDLEDIQKEVDEAMNPQPKKELTPEQKQIAELKAMVEALSKGSKKELPQTDDALKTARAEYEKAAGKKGHHSWSVETINQKIKEFQEAQ